MEWLNFCNQAAADLGGGLIALFVVLALWSIIWKGLALWKSARQGSKPWFVVLLLVNTLGILEILYLYVFSRRAGTPVSGPRM